MQLRSMSEDVFHFLLSERRLSPLLLRYPRPDLPFEELEQALLGIRAADFAWSSLSARSLSGLTAIVCQTMTVYRKTPCMSRDGRIRSEEVAVRFGRNLWRCRRRAALS